MISFVKHRIFWSRMFGLGLLVIILFSSHSWDENSILDILVEWTGFVFILICTFGRIWCSIYISGYKVDKLIQEGPYSIVRNPLYVFSFIGAMGLGLAAENILVVFVILVLFLFFYRFVVDDEEAELENLHGDMFINYKNITPKWFPNISNYYTSEQYIIKPYNIIKSMMETIWFTLFFMIVQIIERFHMLGYIPVYLRIP